MSNHSPGYDDEIIKNLNQHAGLGATGNFPDGKMTPHDEGELKIAIVSVGDKVVIEFGEPVRWIGLNRDQAVELGRAIIKKARKLR